MSTYLYLKNSSISLAKVVLDVDSSLVKVVPDIDSSLVEVVLDLD